MGVIAHARAHADAADDAPPANSADEPFLLPTLTSTPDASQNKLFTSSAESTLL